MGLGLGSVDRLTGLVTKLFKVVNLVIMKVWVSPRQMKE